MNTVGWILFLVGLIGFILDLLLWSEWGPGYMRRRTVADAGPGYPARRAYGARRTVVEEEDVAPRPDPLPATEYLDHRLVPPRRQGSTLDACGATRFSRPRSSSRSSRFWPSAASTAARARRSPRPRRRRRSTHGARIVHTGSRAATRSPSSRSGRTGRLLVVLHGRGAGPEQFLTGAFFQELGATESPTVVMLNGGDHSFWHNRNSGKWASMVLNTVIPDAQRRFHTSGKVGIGGISMGGYGALHIASLRPSEFCGVGAHSAALWRARVRQPGRVRQRGRLPREQRLPRDRQAEEDGGLDGHRERRLVPRGGQRLARKLSVILHVYPGGHDSAYWNARMPMYFALATPAGRARQSSSDRRRGRRCRRRRSPPSSGSPVGVAPSTRTSASRTARRRAGDDRRATSSSARSGAHAEQHLELVAVARQRRLATTRSASRIRCSSCVAIPTYEPCSTSASRQRT